MKVVVEISPAGLAAAAASAKGKVKIPTAFPSLRVTGKGKRAMLQIYTNRETTIQI